MQIKHRQVAVASPWANGVAERVNRFLKSSLAKLVETPSDWENHLSKVQYVLNNTHHKAIGSTPSKLLLGYDQRAHDDAKLRDEIDRLVEINNDICAERETARDVTLQVSENLRDYNKRYYDLRHRKPSQYRVGELVLVRDTRVKPGVNSKLKLVTRARTGSQMS